jgi:hypothetical protein
MEGSSGPGYAASERLEARLLRWDAAIRRSEGDAERAEAGRQRARAAHQRAAAAREQANAGIQKDHFLERIGGMRSSEADQPERLASQRELLADGRERIANQREAEADERDRIANDRETQADERERMADYREAEVDEREDHLSEWAPAVSETEGVETWAANQQAAHRDRRERLLRHQKAEFDERQRLAEQHELAQFMSRSAEQLRPAATNAGATASLSDRAATLRALGAGLADRMADQAEQFATHLENAAARGDRERRLAISKGEREIARIGRENAARLRDLDRRFEPQHLRNLSGSDPVPEGPPAGGAPRSQD